MTNFIQRPSWLKDADANYAAAIDDTNHLHEMMDNMRDEDYMTAPYINIMLAVKAAQTREFECATISHELYQIWQSGGHPVVFHEAMVTQTAGAV